MHLPFAQRKMNSMLHSSTGVKPSQIVFGREFTQDLKGRMELTNNRKPTEERKGVLNEVDDEENKRTLL